MKDSYSGTLKKLLIGNGKTVDGVFTVKFNKVYDKISFYNCLKKLPDSLVNKIIELVQSYE